MKEHIHHLLEQTVANLKSAGVLPADLEARVQVDRCKEKAHGDLATNLAMLLAKPARKNPRELAAAIIEHLPASDLIAKVEIAGPGFINFFFDPSWLAGQVEAMVTSDNANVKLPAPQTVVVDYSAPTWPRRWRCTTSAPPCSVTWPPAPSNSWATRWCVPTTSATGAPSSAC
jgi:arginyl-tRNA synthetase